MKRYTYLLSLLLFMFCINGLATENKIPTGKKGQVIHSSVEAIEAFVSNGSKNTAIQSLHLNSNIFNACTCNFFQYYIPGSLRLQKTIQQLK